MGILLAKPIKPEKSNCLTLMWPDRHVTSSATSRSFFYFVRRVHLYRMAFEIWNRLSTYIVLTSVASPRGGGGGRHNLRSDTPWDRCRSEEIFVSERNGGMFTGFAQTFYMHRRCGGRSYDYEKRGSCGSCWRSYSGRPSVKLRGPWGSFSPGIGPPKHKIVILFLF